jgi:hypothetical protein
VLSKTGARVDWDQRTSGALRRDNLGFATVCGGCDHDK